MGSNSNNNSSKNIRKTTTIMILLLQLIQQYTHNYIRIYTKPSITFTTANPATSIPRKTATGKHNNQLKFHLPLTEVTFCILVSFVSVGSRKRVQRFSSLLFDGVSWHIRAGFLSLMARIMAFELNQY